MVINFFQLAVMNPVFSREIKLHSVQLIDFVFQKGFAKNMHDILLCFIEEDNKSKIRKLRIIDKVITIS